MRIKLLLISALLCSQSMAADFGPRPAKPADLTNYLTGDAADAPNQAAGGPAVLLMGGSSEVDEAFSTLAYPIINGGDIVVLRTSGSDGYQDYLYELVSGPLKPHSVETMLVNSRAKADTDYVEWAVRSAEMVWFAGGDQSTYTDNWMGTKVQTAVQEAYDRGAVVGGTSAGMAIMGQFIFSPDDDAPTGAEAIANPYRAGNRLLDRMVDSRLMDDIITDTHFAQRDRMGRPMSWMAKLRQDGRASRIIAIAADERASIFIDKDRIGHVLCGTATRGVFVMWEDGETARTQVASGQPLKYADVLRARLTTGQTWDFNTMTGSRYPIRLSVEGTAAAPFTPQDAYTEEQGAPPKEKSAGMSLY